MCRAKPHGQRLQVIPPTIWEILAWEPLNSLSITSVHALFEDSLDIAPMAFIMMG